MRQRSVLVRFPLSKREPLLNRMKSIPGEFRCPTCGKVLSPNARSCGACRAEYEGSEWLAPETYDGLHLVEGDFDYDEFVRREFGSGGRGGNWFTRLTPKERFWWVVAVVLLVVFTLGAAFIY